MAVSYKTKLRRCGVLLEDRAEPYAMPVMRLTYAFAYLWRDGCHVFARTLDELLRYPIWSITLREMAMLTRQEKLQELRLQWEAGVFSTPEYHIECGKLGFETVSVRYDERKRERVYAQWTDDGWKTIPNERMEHLNFLIQHCHQLYTLPEVADAYDDVYEICNFMRMSAPGFMTK
jgi:hypothetical protein